MSFDSFIAPLLELPLFWIIFIISLLVTVISTLVYKWTTDQVEMKRIRDEIKEIQKKTRELRDKPEEALKMNQRAMELSMKTMKESFKSTFITLIPMLIIFWWMSSTLAYEPIHPDTNFNVTVNFDKIIGGNIEVTTPKEVQLLSNKTMLQDKTELYWTMNAPAGEYNIEFNYNGQKFGKPVLVTEQAKYTAPVQPIKKANVASVSVSNKSRVAINLFGWKINWLWTYIILSLLLSIAVRKLFKVY